VGSSFGEKIYERLDSADVKHKGVREDGDADGDRFALLLEPRVRLVKSSISEGRFSTRNFEYSAGHGRIYPNKDIGLWRNSVIKISGIGSVYAKRVMFTSEGKEMLFGGY
jgi:hypothetical protein